MLDWRVDTFLDVCETLNYTHTASRLNVTQPAVSQHISWLEKQLGVDLFLRRGRSLVLTQAGILARDLLRSQRNDERLLRQRLEEQSSGHSTLSIGATLTAGEYLLAKPLALWCKKHPQVDVHLDMADTQDLLQKLNAGEIDCALVEGIFDSTQYAFCQWAYEKMVCVEAPYIEGLPSETSFVEGFSSETLCCNDLFSAAPFVENSPLEESRARAALSESQRTAKSFLDLLDSTLIIREPGSGSRAVLEAMLAKENLVPQSFKRVVEVKGVGAALEMAAAGLGITFAYESAVRERLRRGQLHEIPLVEHHLGHPICFVWRKDTYFKDRFEQLFTELQELKETFLA